MKPLPVLFGLIAVGFIGFELHAFQRNSYRMQPDHIFGRFVTAARAAEHCGVPEGASAEKFSSDYKRARERAIQSELRGQEAVSMAAAAAAVAAQQARVRGEIDALFAAKGCQHPELRKLAKRYRILAR